MPGAHLTEGRNWEGCLEPHGWRVFEVVARGLRDTTLGAMHSGAEQKQNRGQLGCVSELEKSKKESYYSVLQFRWLCG